MNGHLSWETLNDLAADGDLEFGGRGVFGDSAGAQFVVPVRAELSAPDAGVAAGAGFTWPKRKAREFAHAQGGGALFEIVDHGRRTEARERVQ